MHFMRMVRTNTSEIYGIVDDAGDIAGRIDLHYSADGRVNGLVTVSTEMSKDEELAICEKIDDEIVNDKDLEDDDFSITFVQARSMNIYGNTGA